MYGMYYVICYVSCDCFYRIGSNMLCYVCIVLPAGRLSNVYSVITLPSLMVILLSKTIMLGLVGSCVHSFHA